ncbi:MAG TPA: aminotransferase class I/II-fold pyridoxal phosphate-dependent enzyme, partial [Anaerolineales bacterium]
EGHHPMHAHLSPIYQTSTFSFPDVNTGASIFKREMPGFVYTRIDNPNQAQLAEKIAVLEGIDLLRAQPGRPAGEIVNALVFSSGMAAITAGILARVKGGDTIIAQESLYGATFNFLHDMAPLYGIKVVWLNDVSPEKWEEAFRANPHATLAYAESPSNPVLELVDLKAVAEIAHRYEAWLAVDNTFASPYGQRPLTLGADIVMHSTTKYLSGHGQVVGGVVVSNHVDFIHNQVCAMLKILGGVASPFDCWLAAIGLRTFEIRMERHGQNAMELARWLERRPEVERVYYPGLESFPGHALARRQMLNYGGMISFELKGGLEAGKALMDHVKTMTLAVSLGNVDTLIQHPASMTHASVDRQTRLKTGVTDGLVRLSVGIENIQDLIADFEQALEYVKETAVA